MILGATRVGDTLLDVRIEHGVIVELGRLGAPDLDAGGRWLLPGLWDQHVHVAQWAMHRQRVDLSGATSAAHAAALISAATRPPAGVPLVGGGFRDATWPDIPTAALLDAAGADPIVLVSADLHSAWLNTAAMRRFGAATALVREDEAFRVVTALDDVPADVLDGWIADAGRDAASRGVVGVVDLEMTWTFDDWLRRMGAGFDTLRVRAGVYPRFLQRAIEAGYRTGDALAPLLQVGPFKVITDGSLNTRTAYCIDPYPGMGDYRGLLTVPPDELLPMLRIATAAGLEPAVHAIGDDANRLALDALAEVGGGRIEHAQLLADADLARFAALGVTASVQPEHAMDDRDVADRFWEGRTARAFPLRSLVDAGARLLLGSDAPVAPLDPWITMAAAVGRSRDGREPWHPEQRIDTATALAASAQSSIAVGQPADLVLVELDPLTASPEQLRSMPVATTLLGGRITFDAR